VTCWAAFGAGALSGAAVLVMFLIWHAHKHGLLTINARSKP
jgi:hypothetical protein